MLNKIALGGLLLAVSSPLLAHLPYLETKDFNDATPYVATSKMEKSIAVYSSLNYEPLDRLDVFEINLSEQDLREGQSIWGTDLERWQTAFIRRFDLSIPLEDGTYGRRIHFGNLVPACSEYQYVEMRLALIGPKQPALAQGLDSLGPRLPDFVVDLINDSDGIYLLERSDAGPIYYEEITGKNYFYPESVDLVLSKAGRYRILVWEANDQPVDYTLELGDIESWGAKDIAHALKVTPPIMKHQEVHPETCRQDLRNLWIPTL